jgi:hypothetical protein
MHQVFPCSVPQGLTDLVPLGDRMVLSVVYTDMLPQSSRKMLVTVPLTLAVLSMIAEAAST